MTASGGTEAEPVGAVRPRFFSDVALLAGGTALSQVILLAATPLVARLYSPTEYGVWALFMSFGLTWSTVSSLRYEPAIVIPAGEDEAADIVVLCFAILLTVVVLAIAAIAVGHRWIAHILGLGRVGWLWALPPFVFAAGAVQILSFWATRTRRFKAIATARIMQSAATIGLQIACALYLRVGASGLIAGAVGGQICAAAALVGSVARHDRRTWSGALQRANLRAPAHQFRNFPLYTAPYSLVGVVGKRLVVLLLAAVCGAAVAGHFEIATKMVFFPVTLVAGAVNQVFFPRAARELGNGAGLAKFVVRVQTLIVAAAGPIFLAGALNAPFLFSVLFRAAWTPAAVYGSLLAMPAFILLLTSWIDRFYDILGRQRLSVALEISYNVVALGAFGLCLRLTRDPVRSALCYCFVTAAYNVFWLVVTFRVAGFAVRALAPVARSVAFVCSVLILGHVGAGAIGMTPRNTFAWDLLLAAIVIVYGTTAWNRTRRTVTHDDGGTLAPLLAGQKRPISPREDSGAPG